MATNTNNMQDSRGAARRKSLAIVAALLLLSAAISGAWLYYTSDPGAAGSSSDEANLQQGDSRVEIGPMIDIREFIVNIISEDNSHYLRISMTIELSDKDAYDEMNMRMPQIRDAILMLASSKTFEELYDVHGKKQLKAELLIELNEMLTRGEAVAVYFNDFVVQ
ncbi:MAG: flagellar basal body-associated FliL family protein [Desulfofustis sp.]|jgi:flagellar protein FliL